jgi:hypothetical protein
MEIFDNVKPLEPGTYKVEITNVLTKVSQEHGTDLFIVEMRILESSCPQFREGDSTSWVQNCKDKKVYGPALSNFIVATLGYDARVDDAKVNAEILPRLNQFALAAATKGLLNKFHVYVDVKATVTKAGHPFKLHTWRKASSPEENAARKNAA